MENIEKIATETEAKKPIINEEIPSIGLALSVEELVELMEEMSAIKKGSREMTIEIPLVYFEELIKARTERDAVKKIALNASSYQIADIVTSLFEATDAASKNPS